MSMIEQVSRKKARLEAIYQRKLADLEELKIAILQTTFAGPVQCDGFQEMAVA